MIPETHVYRAAAGQQIFQFITGHQPDTDRQIDEGGHCKVFRFRSFGDPVDFTFRPIDVSEIQHRCVSCGVAGNILLYPLQGKGFPGVIAGGLMEDHLKIFSGHVDQLQRASAGRIGEDCRYGPVLFFRNGFCFYDSVYQAD